MSLMEPTVGQALQQAITAHREGRLQEAERLYRAILQSQPNHPDANHNLGVLIASINDPELALPLLQTALKTHPKIEQFWLSYVNALINLDWFESAWTAFDESKRELPPSEAQDAMEVRLIIASVERSSTSLSENQDVISFHNPRLVGQTIQAKLKELMEAFSSDNPPYAQKLALDIVKEYPSNSLAWKVLSAVLKQAGRLNESLRAGKKAIDLMPDDAESHHNLGIVLTDLGQLTDAEKSLIEAVRLKPDFAEAHRALALLKRFETYDEQYLQMQAIYHDAALPMQQRCQINFALGKACEDLGDYRQAIHHFDEGNQIQKGALTYNISQDERLFKKIRQTHPEIRVNSAVSHGQRENLTPIFIIGMPRSGTTLTEQIVSSHSQVTGAGELPFVNKFGSDLATGRHDITRATLNEFREDYLAALSCQSEGASMVTDKMPQNFLYLGLIAAALPESRIIHVRRQPEAVCWSNYKQYFGTNSLAYSCSLQDIVQYYRLYNELMAFWEAALPLTIYNLNYEMLTAHQEAETRKLIDFLGIPWEEACMRPQENKRIVSTASKVQVRQSVFQHTSVSWKNYLPFINGAFEKLQGE